MADNPENANALARFSQSTSVRELFDAVTVLIKTKEIHAIHESAEFVAGRTKLQQFASNRSDVQACLLAIATLQRLRAVLKRRNASAVTALLQQIVAAEMPSLQLLDNAGARYYAASALELSNGAWVGGYAARELTLEASSDNAAKVLAEVLLRAAGNVENAFRMLAPHAGEIAKGALKPSDVVARRIKRVLSALRHVLRTQHPDPGAGVAKQLRTYLIVALERLGPTDDDKVLKQLLDTTAGTINDLIRYRLSLVVNSDLYLVLTFLRRWSGGRWSGGMSRSAEFKALGQTLIEGLRISARQGITDQGLFEAAELVFGTRDKALQATQKIADEEPGLSESVQTWLRKGRVVAAQIDSVFAMQHESLQSDHYLATALLAALDAERADEASTPSVGDALRAIKNLARARALEPFGGVGSIVDYSRIAHAVVGGTANTAKVRVVRPGVERVAAGGNRSVVVKAIVETTREG